MADEGDVPRPLLEKPDSLPHLEFAWRAFWELNNDRAIGMGGTGPIPFASLDCFARRYGVESSDEFERLLAMVRALDGAYQIWMAEKAKTS